MSIQPAVTVIEEWDSIDTPPPPAISAVTVDPGTTALLLMDFLASVCTSKRPRAERAVPALKAFLDAARAHKMLVVHTSTGHGANDGSDLAEALRPIAGERVYKARFDKFHGNDLEAFLRGRGVGTVIATGTSANGCLLGTTAGAVLRGFRAIVPVDGMPAATAYQEQFVAWQIANAPGLRENATLTRLDLIGFRS